ncbi:translation initiation factor eIF-1A [Candidatus Woesearchaeota archaeon CG10_big_fil_rev_8_21_14_0_10_32_9]|nr:MAG: translation initiation factor eIF-1A [Candidatus Woesearchaeota archaeon CG10_big_fil_rev_8_21_14_0_10_32_9]
MGYQKKEDSQDEFERVKLPRGNEVIGVLESRLGASRCDVRCLDGKTRNCRIPGRLKRKLWVRTGDIVLVEPWEFGGNEKGDIIYKYRPTQVTWLQKNGHLDKLQDLEDF